MIRSIKTIAALALASTGLAGCASMAPEHVRPPAATAPTLGARARGGKLPAAISLSVHGSR